eukprot:6173329-Pleurochrysis_carterae.AAC.4
MEFLLSHVRCSRYNTMYLVGTNYNTKYNRIQMNSVSVNTVVDVAAGRTKRSCVLSTTIIVSTLEPLMRCCALRLRLESAC